MNNLKRSSIFSLLGFAIPTLVVLISYPILVRELGQEAFGLYILATSISGTLAFLDLGLSAATLKFIAEYMAEGERSQVADTILTSLFFYGGIGILGAFIIWFISPILIDTFSVKSTLRPDSLWAFRLSALQFSTFFLTTVFVSVFKGLNRFDLSTLILSILSVLTYGGGIAMALLTDFGLIGVTAASLAANVLVLAISSYLCVNVCSKHGIVLVGSRPTLTMLRRMLGFGSIMSLNSIAGFMLYQIQRYLVGILIGPAAVSAYQIAMTIPSKAHAVVNALTETLFPIASATKDLRKLRRTYLRMLVASGGIALIILLPMAAFPDFILGLWIGDSASHDVATLVSIFALAYFFIALSPAPYHVVNGIGKPWYNTVAYMTNGITNIILISLLSLNGISLSNFAWAFAASNILNAFAYQIWIEVAIWRRLPKTSGLLER